MFTPTPLRMLISFVAVVMLTAPIRAGTGKMMTVAADGSGDFASVQAAVDAAPAGSADRIVIHIKPGTYKERVRVGKDKVRVTFKGDDAKSTLLTYDLDASKTIPPATRPVGTRGSCSTLIEGDDFVAQNITFANTA